MRVRLQPARSVASTREENCRRYSPVRNWFVDSNVRGNCGKSVGSARSPGGGVVGVAAEGRVRAPEVLVEPHLDEVLVDRLVERECVRRQAAPEIGAVRQRELVEIRPYVGTHGQRDRASAGGRQDPQPCGLVRNDSRDGLAELLAQALVAQVEEALVLAQRARERGAELVAAEVGLRVGIEEVAGGERGVPWVLVEAAVPVVLARLRDDVDLAAGVAAELGRGGGRLPAALPHPLAAAR